MSRLSVENLAVRLGGKTLLHPVDLQLGAGEVVSIIGPNGAGKTTLLRAISGDLKPCAGKVWLAGQALNRLAPAAGRGRWPYWRSTTHWNLRLPGWRWWPCRAGPTAPAGCWIWKSAAPAMAAMDVSHLADRLYPTLSGGEQQRLHLARVLAQVWREEDAGSRLLLLDEPVTSLDIGHQHQLMKAVRRFAATGVAVLMTVHDITLAAAYSDRILVLSEGRCVASGAPEQVLTEPLVQQVFATPVMILPHPQTGKPIVVGKYLCD